MLKSTGIVLAFLAVLELSASFKLQPNELLTSLDQSRNDLINELSQQVADLINNASKSYDDNLQLLNATQTKILKDIDAATLDLKQELRQLDKDVEKKRDEATAAGKDVDSCVNAERRDVLFSIILSELLLCSETVPLAKTALQLAKLKAIQTGASFYLTYCNLRHPLSNSGLKTCVLEKMEDSNKIIANAETTIAEGAEKATSQGAVCIADTKKGIEEKIQNIAQKFNDCCARK